MAKEHVSHNYYLQLPANEPLIELDPHEVVDVKQGQDSENTLFVRKNRILLIYKSTNAAGWSETHRVSDFFSLPQKHSNYPWAVYDGGLVVVRNIGGLEVYQWSNNTLSLQFSESKYDDAFGYGGSDNTFFFGKIYPSEKHLGIVTRIKSDIQFRCIEMNNSRMQLKSLKQSPILIPAWTNQSSILALVENVDNDRQLSIALRTVSELKLFRFDRQYSLQELTTVQEFPTLDSVYDRILFARFNSTRYNDLLHFSTQGLTMYRYNETIPAYEKLFFSSAFSKLRGWNRRTIDTIATHHVEGEGMHELVYSGPNGLSVMHATASDLGFDLTNILDEISDNQYIRYALPKHTLRKEGPSDKVDLFLHTPRGLEWAEVSRYKPELKQEVPRLTNYTDSEEIAKESSTSKIIPEIVPHRHRTLWLHDQLDLASLLQPLNPHTGAVELTIPLIDLRTPFGIPLRKFFQYKHVDYSNELGRGWSFPLDYITLDRYDSAFEQAHVYSLVKDNQQIILTRLYEPRQEATAPSSREGMRFTVDGYPDIKILYDNRRNQWLVQVDKRNLTYVTISGFMTNKVCSTWPLCGSGSTNNLSQPSRWYLIQEMDSAGWDAKYFYEIVKNKSDIRLRSIDLHDNSMVTLDYEQDRISSLKILTMKYSQVVRFHYHDSKDQLLSISQGDRPLFEFGYDGMHRMSRIVYPNGIEWTPEYEEIPIDPSSLKNQIDIHHDGTVFYGPDYLVLVDANLVDGLVTLHIRDPLGGLGPSGKTNATEIVHALEGITRYLVHALANLLVVTIIYDTCKDVAVLQYTETVGWQQREYYGELSLDSTVNAGDTFVLLADTKTLRLLTFSDGQLTITVVRSQLPENFVVHAFPHGYATYDGKMAIFLLHNDGHWLTIRTKAEVNYFQELDRFLNSFAIDSELNQSIRRGMMADMLGSFQQTVVLKLPLMRGPAINIMVRFYIMDLTETPKIHDYYTVNIPYANMNTFNYTIGTKDNDTFVLGYRLEAKKYHLYVKQSYGPHKVAFEEHLAKLMSQKRQMGHKQFENALSKTRKEIDNEYTRIYRAVTDAIIFAIDLSLFGMLTNRDGVLTGSHLITTDGKQWKKKRLDEDAMRLRTVNQQLNDQYRLVKMNASDTFKIVSQSNGTPVFDTQTSKSEELQLVMPFYVLAQQYGSPVRVYFFDSDRKVSILSAKEKFNSASNQMAIVTTVRDDKTIPGSVLFRCVKYFLNPTINVLGRQTLRPPGETPIVTSYRYSVNDLQLYVDGAMFRRLQIVPGAETSRFGWYEQSVDLSSGQTTRRAFNANGHHVVDPKLREQEEKQRESEQASGTKESDIDKMILDRGGRMQIVDLSPYRLVDEMVSYFGFETYEANHFGKENGWIFNKTMIKSEENNRYLRLTQQMDTLTGKFMPLEPNLSFLVSCWVRTSVHTNIGDQLDILTVDVLVDKEEGKKMTSKQAEIKQRIGDWNYVETILDKTHFPTASKLIFIIIVAPSGAHPAIDIDHIRFLPLGLPFEANIYEPITGDLQAVLGGNGLMKSYLHNTKGKKAILFSEHGEVLEFTMNSKTMYSRSGAKPCIVEMKPQWSLFNRFDQASSPWHITCLSSRSWKGSVDCIASKPGASIEKIFEGPWTTLALRFLYKRNSSGNRLNLFWQTKEFHLPCVAASQTDCPSMPSDFEILVFITALRISIWVDGVLVQEALLTDVSAQERVFRLQAAGSFEISEFIEMYNPRIKVTYHNLSGQPTQLIVYEDPQTVRVREIRYDSIERPILQTKWTKIHRKNSEAFFAFLDDFITGFDNNTFLLTGTVADLNLGCEGYPYTYTVYDNDPTENKRLQGLPGKLYGIHGKYRRQYSSTPDNKMLKNLFPSKAGFNQRTTIHPGGAIRVTVEDARGNKVAKYSKVGNYEDRLSTFRYGRDNNKVEQELPPLYHAIVGTSSMVDFFGDNNARQLELQRQWEVRYDYNEQNRLTRKRTPDGGIYQFLYDRYGILRFSLHKDANETLDRVIHFMYAPDGKITREALVNLNETECTTLLDGNKVPLSSNFIDTLYGAQDADPNLRHRSKFASRRIHDDQMTEYLLYDQQNQLLKKIFVVNTINTSYSIDYEYENDKLRSIKYPIGAGDKPYKFIFGYNGHGEVTTIRETAIEEPMLEYTYNADGMVETMKVRTSTDRFFQRNFTYNEPGFLVRLADDYLTEDVSYLETDSYGQVSYTPIYEGLISRTVFTAHWQQSASSLRTGLYPEDFIASTMNPKQAAICFNILKQKGYLNEVNQVTKTFYGERDDDLPFICGEMIPMNHLSAVVSSGSFPHQYGHRYDYDDHDQLIKAKYFHGPDELLLSPLTHRTFAKEIDGVEESYSKNIWDVLLAKGFLSADCTNPNLCHGRPGTKSMFNEFIRKHRYHKHLQTLLSKAIAERKGVSGNEFDARCKQWIVGSNLAKSTCRDIKNSLTKRNFIGDRPENPISSLSDAFRDALKRFNIGISEIVRVLSHHFAKELGRSAGDVQSYEIDANGNHRKFYTGFSRYRLEYRDGTNQITKLHRQYFDRDQREEEHFNMEHNSDGAVVKAEHKGIKRMEYDRILHRVTKMEMQDGRKLLFQYDVRAERTFKQVINPDGTISHEKYYIRDAHGMVLVDMEMTYLAKDQPPDVRITSYIYKDQQLVGFVRNDKLYGVITDHEGSVRLVVRDGEVVAAYDYLPYGQIFRRYGTDLDGQISYLYTGQEWEPETGLYNYRARLYDPDIGRFYQMDPKEQYPSPYVYAGNSPVSLVDPDGEFAFALAVFIMAIIGAYLGAASANNCWNPLKWDWRSSSTWLGLLTGAVTGASIPFNMASSVAFFVGLGLSMSTSIAIMVGAGITFAYFTIAASSGTWDPTKFDFTSPGTWNALMNGVATSSWILMNPSSLISSFTTLTSLAAKAMFIVAKVTMSLGFTYLFAAVSQGGEFDVTKWDFSDPALYMSVIDGFTTATVGLLFVRNIPKQMSKWTGKVKRTVDLFVGNSISYRAHMMLGRDWSSMIMHTKNFLYVNFRNMQTLQKGFLTVGFYSVVCSLRVSQMFDSPIPEFKAVEGTINMLFTTEQFSDFIVKPLSPATPKMMLPKPPNVARLLRFRIRSEAIALGNESVVAADWRTPLSSSAGAMSNTFDRVFRIPIAWLFGKGRARESRIKSAKLSFPSAQASKSARSSYSLSNCHHLRNEQYPDGIIACYGHSTIVSIHPKIAFMHKIEQSDRYKYCTPLTYGGHPSVSCDGEWSSLLYTAKESPRVFDLVDGWLLLAQIAPSAYRELKRAITYLITGKTSPKTNCLNDETISFQKKTLQGKLEQLQTNIQAHDELNWARWTLEDLTKDVHDYFTHGTSSFGLLTDKAKALEEDVHEAIYIHSSQRSFKEGHQKKTNTDETRLSSEDTSMIFAQFANLGKEMVQRGRDAFRLGALDWK